MTETLQTDRKVEQKNVWAEMVVVDDLDRNPAQVYLSGLTSEGSRATMGRALDVIADIASRGNTDRLTFHWHFLTFAHTAAIRAELVERYAPETVNRFLSALRGVLKTAWRLDLMTAEDYHRAADVENVKAKTLPPGRAITPGELAALLNSCGNDASGVRDAAIICLMYCGLRRAEIVALGRGDFSRGANELKVQGKGRKERLVPLMSGADVALTDWLTIRGNEPGPLFVGIKKGGHLKNTRLTTRAINHILSERAGAAGVDRITPHDFRRSVIGDLLDAGADIAAVADLVGHSDLQTTRRYDRRGEKAKRRAVGLLHLPYTRRMLE